MCEAEEDEIKVFGFVDLLVGQQFLWEKSFSYKDTQLFSKLSGDKNAIHLSHEAAVDRGFKGVIVHAARVLGEISRVCGSDFFVNGVIASNLEAQFKRPFLHDFKYSFILQFETLNESHGKKEAIFSFSATDKDGKICLLGKVKLCFP